MTRRRQAIGLLALLALTACRDSAGPEQASSPVAQVKVEVAKARALRTNVRAYGTADFAPESLHSLVATVESRVVRVLVSAGEPVHRGQVLMVVAQTPGTRVELDKARSDLAYNRKELERVSGLRKQELATNADVAAARLAEANATAVLKGIESRIGNPDGELKAEKEGLVASVDAQQGDIVAAGGALLHLADSSDLSVRLGIEPADLSGLREGQKVDLSAIYDDKVSLEGRIVKLVSRIDPVSRMAEAVVEVASGSPLLPGAVVRADIPVDGGPDVIAVPRNSVLKDGERSFLFVVRDGKAIKTWVVTGRENETLLEIRSGVAAGDSIVVEGNYELSDAMSVKIQAEGK